MSPNPEMSDEAVLATEPESRPAPQPVGGHPLGPIFVARPVDHPVYGRIYALVMACLVGGLLVLAWRLAPDARHMGTHEQLGLPPCGFVLVTGFPCPTCGMTTAFACLAHGRIGAAFRAQVAGAFLALAVLAGGAMGLYCAVTGRYWNLNWYRVDPVRLVWWTTLLILASWGVNVAWGLLDGSLPVH